MDIVNRHGNGEMAVIWHPALCIHSAVCAGGCPVV
mgnify:FL=1